MPKTVLIEAIIDMARKDKAANRDSVYLRYRHAIERLHLNAEDYERAISKLCNEINY